MNIKQRLRKLESRTLDRLAEAAAEAMVRIAEAPPLTEQEARSQNPHALLRLIELELHPSKVREGHEFGKHCVRFRRLPLLELWRLFLALKRRQRKVEARRRKQGMTKGSDDYYQFLKNIYGEMTDQSRRAEREALYQDQAHQEPPHHEQPHYEPPPLSETRFEISPPATAPGRLAWAM